MFFSLRTKLIIAITFFTILLMGSAAVLFIREKTLELGRDIFVNQTAFSELTAPEVAKNNELYLAQQSFVLFNREIKGLFQKNPDLAQVQFVNYQGEVLYDSGVESEKQYEGPTRVLKDAETLKQVQSQNLSLRTNKRIVYLKKTAEGEVSFVDENEKTVDPYNPTERISYIVQPAENRYAAIYMISYKNLDERIAAMRTRIILLAVFGVLIGFALAYVFSTRIVKPIKLLSISTAIIAKGDFTHRVDVRTGDELEILGNAFNKMAEDLDASTKAMIYRERVEKELELAAKIQKQILPKEMPKILGLDIAAGLIPADEIGGDVYDFIPVGNDLMMYLGDVTGHGVPSGIVVSIANALFYTFAQKGNVKDVLVESNKVLKAKTSASMFITTCMLQWKTLEQKMEYCSAGHELILHYHAKDDRVTEAPGGGVALGMLPDVSKTLNIQEVTPFEKGDVLLIYSDGIPEAWRSQKEQYGMGRLKRVLQEYATLPSALAVRNGILSDVKEYMGNYKQMDDITLIVLRKV